MSEKNAKETRLRYCNFWSSYFTPAKQTTILCLDRFFVGSESSLISSQSDTEIKWMSRKCLPLIKKSEDNILVLPKVRRAIQSWQLVWKGQSLLKIKLHLLINIPLDHLFWGKLIVKIGEENGRSGYYQVYSFLPNKRYVWHVSFDLICN